MKIVRTAIVAASAMALALLATAPARAADPLGTWLTGDKKGKVKIVNCGDAICGSLTWLAEPNDPTAEDRQEQQGPEQTEPAAPWRGDRARHEARRRRQVARPSLQRRRRRHLYRVVHDDRPQHRRPQRLRHGRIAVQGPDLDAVELISCSAHSRVGGNPGLGTRLRGDERTISQFARTRSHGLSGPSCRPRKPPRRGCRTRA